MYHFPPNHSGNLYVNDRTGCSRFRWECYGSKSKWRSGENVDSFTHTIQLALPDLIASSISLPNSVVNGENFDVTFVAQNAGFGGVSGPWSNRIVLSRDTVLGNSDDVLLSESTETTPLAPSTTLSRTVTVSAPFGVTGTAHLFFITDSSANVLEADENNNQLERNLTIDFARAPSDLIVDALTVNGPIGRGESFDFTYRVRNDGTATTEAVSWNDEVWISNDAVLDSNDSRLGLFSRQGNLGSGASYTQTLSLVMPAMLALGNYYLIVRTDARNQVLEPAAEDNNLRVSEAISVIVAPLPDLVIETVGIPNGNGLQSGGLFTATWTGKNAGI